MPPGCQPRMKRFAIYILVATVALALNSRTALSAEASPADLEFFEKKIRPQLVKHCHECHGAGKTLEANLRLDSQQGWLTGGDRGPALVPGKPDKSLLIRAIQHAGDLEMPPNGKLPDATIQLFEEWIARGAPRRAKPKVALHHPPARSTSKPARNFWAYRPVIDPATPDTKEPRLVRASHRSLRTCKTGSSQYHTQRRRRPPHARPSAVFRSVGSAADAGRDRSLSSRRFSAGLRAAR